MIAIVTDTTCDLPLDLVRQYQIEVVPLYVHFGDSAFRSGINSSGPGQILSNEQFLDRLQTMPTFPTTTPPTVDDFVAVYRRLSSECDAVISIHISSQMSQTYNNALAASKQLGSPNLHVVDSLTVSGGLGLLVLAAARMAVEGATVKAILKQMEVTRAQLRFYLIVDTLEYLHKGGRVGGAKAWVGMLLGLKPVLTMHNGQIEPVTTMPSRARAVARLHSLVLESLAGCAQAQMAVFHVGAHDEARQMAGDLTAEVSVSHLLICEAGPVVAAHTGPGALAVAFYSGQL